MSIFGTGENPKTPQYIELPKKESYLSSIYNKKKHIELKHGFDAMGYEVPSFRKNNAEKMLKDFGINAEDRFFIIEHASEQIMKDNTHKAMDYISKKIDATGTYMILSCLLTGEE